jgi:membrane protease YdiL (CAAX protease family)
MEGLALAIALVLAWYFKIRLKIRLTPLTENFPGDIVLGTAFALPPFGLFLLSISQRAEKMPVVGSLRKIIVNEVRAFFADTALIDLVLISLLAGIAEEILFRGVIQEKLGLVAASIIFGLVHFLSPAYVIVTILMGFYIGIIYQMTNSLLVPIQLHFIYDLAALVYLRFYLKDSNGVSAV